jgi:hypothetical protein
MLHANLSTVPDSCVAYIAMEPEPAPAPAPELRREQRLCTLFRTGRLLSAHGETVCRVRNVSSNGFMADICFAPEAGETVILELAEGRLHPATVKWSQPGRFGAEFAQAHPISEITRPSISPFHRHRAPRLVPANAFVTIRHGDSVLRAAVVNISQTGLAAFAYDLAIADGSRREMLIEIDGMDDLAGRLRWADKGAVGIQFDTPLSFEGLAHWLWATSLAARSAPDALCPRR